MQLAQHRVQRSAVTNMAGHNERSRSTAARKLVTGWEMQ